MLRTRPSDLAERVNTLEVAHLNKDFQGIHALRDVSLSISSGSLIGLIGPNGSGKSTLLNCVSGILRPTSGSVRLDGRAVQRWRPHKRSRAGIGRTFQNIRLFKGLTAQETVEIAILASGACRWRRDSRTHARRLLDDLGIVTLGDASAGTLSYGDQRRLEIARALATSPRFLLLDEPAAGMNEAESGALATAIKGIRDKWGCAIVLVEHDVQMVMSSCDHVFVLNEGRVISAGPPADVQADPVVVSAYLGEDDREPDEESHG